MQHRGTIAARRIVVVLAGAFWLATAPAQTVYRIVGADGKVTFSDRPPATGQAAPFKAGGPGSGQGAEPSGATELPFAMQQVVRQYPVTLYASRECAPCDAGRALLRQRGVPFAEKTIGSQQDMDAFVKQVGASSVPVLTLGGQTLKGFSESQWTSYLDAAGYPAQSVLPPSYKAPAPTPLVPLVLKPAPAADAAPPSPTAEPSTPAAPRVQPSNPAGIQF
jgi:glutaredoxin